MSTAVQMLLVALVACGSTVVGAAAVVIVRRLRERRSPLAARGAVGRLAEVPPTSRRRP